MTEFTYQRPRGENIIDMRWIDINKGDAKCPEMRSRLVGRELKECKDDTRFASTPPTEALRMIVSRASTADANKKPGMITINGFSRAYVYAPALRKLFIRLPPEDKKATQDMVGRLNVAPYGTRDAAKSWQITLTKHLESLGFTRGIGIPAVFRHKERGIWTLVHGDDDVSTGEIEQFDWLKLELEIKYKIKTQLVGEDVRRGVVQEGKILNRIARWTQEGFEVEGDRHAELIVERVLRADARGVGTPGVEEGSEEVKRRRG